MKKRASITLPWPPSKTSANAPRQGDFYGKSRAAKAYKATCAKECWAQGIRRLDLERASVSVTFHPPTLARYDLDNMLGRCKQGLDAVAEAVGVDDALWETLHLSRGEKVKGGCVVVNIGPVEGWTEIEFRGVIS